MADQFYVVCDTSLQGRKKFVAAGPFATQDKAIAFIRRKQQEFTVIGCKIEDNLGGSGTFGLEYPDKEFIEFRVVARPAA